MQRKWRDVESIDDLEVGDLIQHKGAPFYRRYVVTQVYQDRVTAVDTIEASNAIEWSVFQ